MKTFAKIDKTFIKTNVEIVKNSKLIILDGNLPLETMQTILDIACEYKIKGNKKFII